MKKKLISVILSVLVLCVFSPFVVYGDETGDIKITYEFEIDQNGKRTSVAIPNATFNVYKIWGYNTNDQIVFESSFDGVLLSSELATMESEELQKQASLFEGKITDTTPITKTGTTNTQGEVAFNALERGGYLIVQKEPVKVEDEYYLANSFLVTIPYKDVNGDWLTVIDIKPKASLLMSPEISKLVNNVELYGLSAKEEEFTYSIMTALPTIPASAFHVRDKLESVLEFAPYTKVSDIASIKIGATTLSSDEVDAIATIDQTINRIEIHFTSTQIETQKGESVTITFKAKIKKDADLSNYTNGKVPNEACFVADYLLANNNTYTKTVGLSNSSRFSSLIKPVVYQTTETQQKCSKKVYVYPPTSTTTTPTPTPTAPPPIPNTFAMLMEQIENNPWISFAIIIAAFVVGVFVYKSYQKSNNPN